MHQALRTFTPHTHSHSVQVSALELDIIEVDPETKEMLKTLVGSSIWHVVNIFNVLYTHAQDFGNIANLQVTAPSVQAGGGAGGYGNRR